ncbi:MAG: NAD(P)H-hydrate dehydratase [Firmicutes bacterium]|nr:NAD(P)H-hydrate dehydratase [Bacillota bacterium]
MLESIITEKTVKNIIERRKREIHKGSCGRILIAAGSVGMAGAAVLSARGALRSGAGLVQLSVPQEIFPIVQTGVIEATCLTDSLDNIDLSRYNAAAAGPGLGDSRQSVEKVRILLDSFDGPLVLDADGLNIAAREDFFDLMRARGGRLIITPHIGEARRLMAKDFSEKMTRRELAEALAQKTGAVTVLKGAGTVVAAEGQKTYTNTTGNPGMATAGSGDVLTGIVTSLCGQRHSDGRPIEPLEAALAGVYIHGLAGDLGTEEKGEYGLIAGDIAEYTALAVKKILEES